LADTAGLRRAATLWFIAAVLAFAAVVVTYIGKREIRWALLAAAVFLAAMGFSYLQRSRSAGV
jgi:hypothetical protein